MWRWAMGGLVAAAAAIGVYWWHSQPEPVIEGPHGNAVKVVNQPVKIFEGKELARQQLLGGLALGPGQGFPASLPWAPLHHIGTSGLYPLESLLHQQPVLFLEWCQAKYTSEVKGYTCIFCKQERVKGKLLPAEKIDIHFREEPFSVHMHFLEGGAAKKVVYPDGAKHDYLAARPKGIIGLVVVSRVIDGPDAMENSRFPISQFGIAKGAQSTLASMRRAQARGALHIRYDGVYKVPQLGDRTCYKFVRTPYTPHEDDDLNELTLYIDTETWLQVGSVLKNERGELIAEYWFRDVNLNPEFDKDQFTRSAL